MMLTFQEVKKNIILDPNIYYFDFTASGLAYEPIEQALQDILKKYANIHSEIGSNALFMTDLYERSREQIKKNLDISDDFFVSIINNF